jgi:hypothetical protein
VKKFANGDLYDGTWQNDLATGIGVYKWINGNVYDGTFLGGAIQGRGTKK